MLHFPDIDANTSISISTARTLIEGIEEKTNAKPTARQQMRMKSTPAEVEFKL